MLFCACGVVFGSPFERACIDGVRLVISGKKGRIPFLGVTSGCAGRTCRFPFRSLHSILLFPLPYSSFHFLSFLLVSSFLPEPIHPSITDRAPPSTNNEEDSSGCSSRQHNNHCNKEAIKPSEGCDDIQIPIHHQLRHCTATSRTTDKKALLKS